MAIQYTSPYNLPYPQIGDPVKDGQANMELLAKRVNTVLTDGSFPASNPDVADITARLNALEALATPVVVGMSGATWGTSLTPAQIPGKDFKTLAETAVVTTDASGYAAVVIPYTFANGDIVTSMVNGDDWARPAATYHISTNLFTNTNNKFYIRVYQGTNPVLNGTCRLNYSVTGW